MIAQNTLGVAATNGILIGLEISEWAGFVYRNFTVKRHNGERLDFLFGRESRGEIPKIGSLALIEYTDGVFPEILGIELFDRNNVPLYKDSAESYVSSMFLGKPNANAKFVIMEMILRFGAILMELTWGRTESITQLIFGLCRARTSLSDT